MTEAKEDIDWSIVEHLVSLWPSELAALKREVGEANWAQMGGEWGTMARPSQQAPKGTWRLWLIMAGRGFGKTRSGAEWIDAYARANKRARIALVGATMRDVRDVMIEGNAGILNLGSRARPPLWQPSLHKLIWHESGAIATCYSAAEPESLRGPEHHAAWADEIGRWGLDADGAGAVAAWNNMQLGLRQGRNPQVVATTTPRATPLMRELLNTKAKTTIISGGPTRANAANMPEAWLAAMEADYAGTRLAQQELEGEFIDDVPGALFARALFDRCRMERAEVDEAALERTVIGVDPPAGTASGEGGDACGIIVAGIWATIIAQDGDALTLADAMPDGGAAGTAVDLVAGCDKRAETCQLRFANIANFRGEPHLPGTDLLTRYPGG